jgi:hypothetical protein
MAITTRTAKGSKLTIAEMDGNLTTLDNQSFKDGVYSITSGSRTDSITALASGSIEIKSIIPSTGEVLLAATLEFSPTEFEEDIIVDGTYTDITPTGGSGTGLVVTVVVATKPPTIENPSPSPSISSVEVTAGGTGYQPDDVVSIATSELGAESSTESTAVILGARDLSATNQQRILMTPTGILMPDLPTEDPNVAGQLYNDSNALKISTGLG